MLEGFGRAARWALLGASIMASAPAAAQDAPLLHSMFQDHGVLQRERPIAVWGTAKPGETVRVSLGDKTATARAGKDGKWTAKLPALPAGGPYVLTAQAGGRTQTVQDLLVGDVWLCSGQSNMEMQVSHGLNGGFEVAMANEPEVRLLTVAHDIAMAQQPEFLTPVKWQQVTPQSIADFSAVCWFMARDLRTTEKVPMGLIDASWGGSAVNPWRTEASLAADPVERDGIALLRLQREAPAKAALQWGALWGDWWRKASGDTPGREPWQAGAPGEWKPVPSFTPWESWGIPELSPYNGVLWYRVDVELTAEQAAKPATLTFGIVDDLDVTWVNGTPVGSTASWDKTRAYALTPGVLRPGVNRIVLAAYDAWGFGGLTGTPEQRAIRFGDGTTMALPETARWQYRHTPGPDNPPHAPWETTSGLAGMHNGMIAPMANYGLRGVAWYQGETDAGNPGGYAERLASLFAGWRGQFENPELPFLVVQLAGWGARVQAPVESGAADIRDQQRKAVAADRHAGLAVAIDLGEPTDIHPTNKQDVGRRLARAARVVVYRKPGSPSGPWAAAATRSGGDVSVRFDAIEKGLVTYNALRPIGFELCGAGPGSCRFVDARLEGANVVLDAAGGPAERVRFCWGESPMCNLYDGSGLPAAPFELAVR